MAAAADDVLHATSMAAIHKPRLLPTTGCGALLWVPCGIRQSLLENFAKIRPRKP